MTRLAGVGKKTAGSNVIRSLVRLLGSLLADTRGRADGGAGSSLGATIVRAFQKGKGGRNRFQGQENTKRLPTTLILPGIFFVQGSAIRRREDIVEVPFSSLDTGIQPEEVPGSADAARELAPGNSMSKG